MKRITENRLFQADVLREKRKQLLLEVGIIDAKLDSLFGFSSKNVYHSLDSNTDDFNYYEEIVQIFKMSPLCIFSIRDVFFMLKEKYGEKSVKPENVKTSLYYASKRKNDLDWIARGKYRLHQK
jgi:hypothetical protein